MKLLKKNKTHVSIQFTVKEIQLLETGLFEFDASVDSKSNTWRDISAAIKKLTYLLRRPPC